MPRYVSRHAPGMEKYFTPKEPLNPGPVWLDKWILDTGGESFHQTVLAIVATLLIGLVTVLSFTNFDVVECYCKSKTQRKVEAEIKRMRLLHQEHQDQEEQREAAAERSGDGGAARGCAEAVGGTAASTERLPRLGGGLVQRRGGGARKRIGADAPSPLLLPGTEPEAATQRVNRPRESSLEVRWRPIFNDNIDTCLAPF